VIKSFADKETRKLFEGTKSRAVPRDVRERAESKLAVLDAAKSLEDLKVPPGNRLEALRGDREGQHSIRINRQYRVSFVWDGEAGGAYHVEITDYHD
jgi:proteic killer suppression protein